VILARMQLMLIMTLAAPTINAIALHYDINISET
jgi:hypothetical protein